MRRLEKPKAVVSSFGNSQGLNGVDGEDGEDGTEWDRLKRCTLLEGALDSGRALRASLQSAKKCAQR